MATERKVSYIFILYHNSDDVTVHVGRTKGSDSRYTNISNFTLRRLSALSNKYKTRVHLPVFPTISIYNKED